MITLLRVRNDWVRNKLQRNCKSNYEKSLRKAYIQYLTFAAVELFYSRINVFVIVFFFLKLVVTANIDLLCEFYFGILISKLSQNIFEHFPKI